MTDANVCFVLKLALFLRSHDPRLVIIRAFDDLGWDDAGRVKLTVEVRHGGKVIFPRGKLTCALHGSSDGLKARELVLSLVAMRPEDTDADYFADYTPEQLEWAETYGELIGAERETRYCDANGNPRTR